MATTVGRINLTPVKSLGLSHPHRVELGRDGVAGDRAFYVTDADGRRVGGVQHGSLVRIAPAWDGTTLALSFPDGTVVEGEPELEDAVETDFYGVRAVHGNVVAGPWADALSDFVGSHLRLVRVDERSHAKDIAPATIVSDGSLAALDGLDGRRFRMTFELEGCRAFEEDEWDGRLVSVGEAVVRLAGPVPRCAVTTQDPETGIRDHDTLGAIRAVRGTQEGGIYFGMYAEIVEPGAVAVGDAFSAA